MTKEDQHQKLMEDLYKTNQIGDFDEEFIWDGPSDWPQYSSGLRIMFLVKESRNNFHPSTPLQKNNSKFSNNIARWKEVIKNAISKKIVTTFIEDDMIPPYNDDVAIVEVKKINHENRHSSPKEIKDYARRDQWYLSKQINIIDPHIIVCCGTIDAYDIIFEDLEIRDVQLFSFQNKTVWYSNNRVVIDFYHPATFPTSIPSVTKKDVECFFLLNNLISDEAVQSKLLEILHTG